MNRESSGLEKTEAQETQGFDNDHDCTPSEPLQELEDVAS